MKDFYDGDYVPRKSHLEEPKAEDLRIKELAEAGETLIEESFAYYHDEPNAFEYAAKTTAAIDPNYPKVKESDFIHHLDDYLRKEHKPTCKLPATVLIRCAAADYPSLRTRLQLPRTQYDRDLYLCDKARFAYLGNAYKDGIATFVTQSKFYDALPKKAQRAIDKKARFKANKEALEAQGYFDFEEE